MNRKWSTEQKAQIMAMRHRGMTLLAIGALFSATEQQISGVIKGLKGRSTGNISKNPVAAELLNHSGTRMKIPSAVLSDRDRRINTDLTLNMTILGDPVVPRWNSNA
jgi:transcriptional regulator